MATFRYDALTAAGRLMTGTVEAGSPQEATETLRQMNLNVNLVEKAVSERPRTAVGRNEFLLFNQQLASIARAGVPLERGLRELAHDMGSQSMRQLVADIADDLEKGVPIEEAFQKRERSFPPLYGRILKAGVETGRLSEMLASLNRHLELAGHTRRIVVEAVSYPLVILALGAIVITGVFAFVIPQFKAVVQEMVGGRLNPVTTAMFTLSENLVPIWTVVGVLIAASVFGIISLSSTPGGRRTRERLFLRLPVIGRLYHATILSRMSEAMAVLIGAGCDVPEALRLGAVSSGSSRLVQDSETVSEQIEQGSGILEAGHRAALLPRLFLYSIQLGAQRNELQDNLRSLGQMYADQARVGQSRLQTILLPTMIVAIGALIGIAILAMFLPMIQVVTSLGAA
ncbi:MAG TPA: type II secretion system F family protein [Sedimentisphaerales bacterium]|nr:type II secretion system F family protein [Sedimentisphaerales bacterium]